MAEAMLKEAMPMGDISVGKAGRTPEEMATVLVPVRCGRGGGRVEGEGYVSGKGCGVSGGGDAACGKGGRDATGHGGGVSAGA